MNRRIVNFVVVIVLTLSAAGFMSALKKMGPLENKRFFNFPLVIGDWTGREIPMSDYVYKGIETPYLFLRDYSSPRYQNPVNLSIVWFDDTNIAFHAPESCLGGVSNEVKEEGPLRVKLDREYEIRKFITNLGGTDYLVIYFFDVDGFITTNQSDIRMKVLSKRLLFRRASASFIRLMAPVRANEQETLKSLLDFLRVMYPLVPEYMYTEAAMRTR
jgi:EpsI family protein